MFFFEAFDMRNFPTLLPLMNVSSLLDQVVENEEDEDDTNKEMEDEDDTNEEMEDEDDTNKENETEAVKPWPWEVKPIYEDPPPVQATDKRKEAVEDEIDLRCTELDVIVTPVVVGPRTRIVSRETPPPKRLRSCLKDDNDDSCERPRHRVRFDV